MGVLIAGHPRASELSKALFGFKELMLVGFFLSIGMKGLPTWDMLIAAVLLCLYCPSRPAFITSLSTSSAAGPHQPFRLPVTDQLLRVRADRGGHCRRPGSFLCRLAPGHGHDHQHQLCHFRTLEHPFRVYLPPNVPMAVPL
jgi:hypothetical protein